MIEFTTIIHLVAAHWIADFVFQTDEMAKNKSSCNWALLSHIGVYTLAILINTIHLDPSPMWLVLVAVTHLVTDYFTSRLTKKLYEAKKIHEFFVVIGADQALHMIQLLGLWVLFN